MAGVPDVSFAHRSEEFFADLLDERGIRWLYEPHRFVTERTADGRIAEEFVPDFYLPGLDVYVECTTMPSGRLSRKRRKARRAMEQHGIRVMILTLPPARDELKQDADGGLGRAALLEQADRLVEVDAHVRRESFRLGAPVAGAFELIDTPLKDVALLRCGRDLESRHIPGFPRRRRVETSQPDADAGAPVPRTPSA